MLASRQDRFLKCAVAVLAISSAVVVLLMAMISRPRPLCVAGPWGAPAEMAMTARTQGVTDSAFDVVNYPGGYGHTVGDNKLTTGGASAGARPSSAKEGLWSKRGRPDTGSPIGSNHGKLRKQS